MVAVSAPVEQGFVGLQGLVGEDLVISSRIFRTALVSAPPRIRAATTFNHESAWTGERWLSDSLRDQADVEFRLVHAVSGPARGDHQLGLDRADHVVIQPWIPGHEQHRGQRIVTRCADAQVNVSWPVVMPAQRVEECIDGAVHAGNAVRAGDDRSHPVAPLVVATHHASQVALWCLRILIVAEATAPARCIGPCPLLAVPPWPCQAWVSSSTRIDVWVTSESSMNSSASPTLVRNPITEWSSDSVMDSSRARSWSASTARAMHARSRICARASVVNTGTVPGLAVTRVLRFRTSPGTSPSLVCGHDTITHWWVSLGAAGGRPAQAAASISRTPASSASGSSREAARTRSAASGMAASGRPISASDRGRPSCSSRANTRRAGSPPPRTPDRRWATFALDAAANAVEWAWSTAWVSACGRFHPPPRT